MSYCPNIYTVLTVVTVVIPASPRAANGLRPLAAPASVASVGAALCLKIRLFCQVNSWIAILRQHKILSGTYNG